MQSMQKQVAIFGGAFNPPHLGHAKVVETLLRRGLAQEVWLMPVGRHPFFKQTASELHRLAMLELLRESMSEFAKNRTLISTFELEQKGVSYSYQTLSKLSVEYSNIDFSFVMGSDNLSQFTQWRSYRQLLSRFPIYVYPRRSTLENPLFPGMRWLTGEPISVSSTLVRSLVSDGLTRQLVPEPVAGYIYTHALYQ